MHFDFQLKVTRKWSQVYIAYTNQIRKYPLLLIIYFFKTSKEKHIFKQVTYIKSEI